MDQSFRYIRKKKVFKYLAAFLALNILAEVFTPTVAFALTSGPSQPEMQSFEPAGTSDMVDVFTGDFNYNIPLFDLPGPNGGYPFNLAYHSGVGMDQEATWVGLGWNINPGAINRDKRGLPDDFNGDHISTELDMKRNVTYGVITAVGLELWGGDINASSGNLNLGLTIYNNSYKGIGYNTSSSISFTNEHASLGLGFSLDSQEGVGANADLSYGKNMRKANPTYGGVGVDFNSKRGLNVSVFGRIGGEKVNKFGKDYEKGTIMNGNSTYSFSEQSFMPAYSNAMKGSNLSVAIKFGLDGGGAFGNFTLGGFYREEQVKSVSNTYYGFGYNYLEAAGEKGLMDFNREKDGLVRKETPNLAIPNLSFDTYMASGQGFAGNYRAHRNDIGHLHDPKVESKLTGTSVGIDLGFGFPFHLGLSGSSNKTTTVSGDWSDDNDLVGGQYNNYSYGDGNSVSAYDFENIYYKVKGEPTSFDTDELNYVGKDLAVRAELNKRDQTLDRDYIPQDGKLIPSSGAEIITTTSGRFDKKRIKRNSSIQPVTNALLLTTANEELLGEYDLSYYASAAMSDNHYTPSTYSRSSFSKSHNAGFTCLNPGGMRYVYALPVYNKQEEEVAQTISPGDYALSETTNFITSPSTDYHRPNSDEFYSKTVTPDYAHGYLLTSVLGADYVDLTGNGPTDDDYGYWVKFNYIKASNDYEWRSPYSGEMYIRGLNHLGSDDKAMHSYGKKEIWYLGSAETKSHVAVFKLSDRKDGVEAGSQSDKLKRLDQIDLYSKVEYNDPAATLVPLKTVHFEYSYDLCGHVPNNLSAHTGDNTNWGKLTLKKVWFTYQNNTRGGLSPYTFDYHETISGENPCYDQEKYDRWGGYKNSSDYYKTRNLPYTTQFDPGNEQNPTEKTNFKTQTDKNAAVWNLKEIGLPTGGSMKVEYESDDYAYVQHRKATQMFQIVSLSNQSDVDQVYEHTSSWNTDNDKRRVYFKLENLIPSANVAVAKTQLYNDYLADLKQSDGELQMYFKLRSKLRSFNGQDVFENISGYANLETSSDDYGFDTGATTTLSGITYYTTGYITVKMLSGHNSAINSGSVIRYHPFAVAAWQFMRINCPDLLTAASGLSSGTPVGSNASDKALKVASLLSVVPAAIQIFSGYRKYAYDHKWGRYIDHEKSFIRLCAPDKIKYGGGARVKRLIYNDNWAAVASGETSNEYGQVYDYTTTASPNSTVRYSSGVAQYEPLIGGDEIALRHAKNFVQSIPLATDNNLFFEYPVNESYYPGASVGYSKVTVQSLASYRTNAGNTDADYLDPHINSTGSMVYEFYTAHEFPVITDETDNQVRKFNLFIPIPLVGQTNKNKLFETQGYAITLNDMHGKLKSITNYSKNVNGELSDATSSVQYKYKSKIKNYDGYSVKVLDNEVQAITNESVDKNTAHTTTYDKLICNKKSVIIGEEYDFFTDSRKSDATSEQFGFSFNTEIPLVAAIPCPWPSISYNTKKLRTFVTNKLIQKSGILDTTIVTDGQSIVKTYNQIFDEQTGKPVLTIVTNDFNKPVYNYDHPAFWEYDGMGSAAKNFNFKFYGKINTISTVTAGSYLFDLYSEYDSPTNTTLSTAITKNKQSSTSPSAFPINKKDFYGFLTEGDELIFEKANDPAVKGKATLISKTITYDPSCGSKYILVFHTNNSTGFVDGNEFKFNVIRSGRRNLLNTDAGSITALKDPTADLNRGLYSTTAAAPSLAYDFAAFLNYILKQDCRKIGATYGHYLPIRPYPVGTGSYYNENGEPLCPLLSSLFNYITIGHRPVTDCHQNQTSEIEEYYMSFSYNDENGNCQLGECCLGLYNRYQNPTESFPGGYVLNQISSFDVSGGQLVVYYENNLPMHSETISLDCITTPTDRKYTYIDDVVSSSSVVYQDWWDYNGDASVSVCAAATDQVNLYSIGKKGIWKPYMNYYYKDERVNQELSTIVNLKHDGVYKGDGVAEGLNEFYLFNWHPTMVRPVPVKWMPNSMVSAYDENSNAVQTKDIVGLYSSVKYGYDNQLPIIQGNNALKIELFYESFDDESLLSPWTGETTAAIPHTGKKSLIVTGNHNFDMTGFIKVKPGKEYTISLWTSQNRQDATYANPAGDDISIVINYFDLAGSGIGTPVTIRPSGNVIEKWQRIEGSFRPPVGTNHIEITFNTDVDGGVSYSTYFDDLRIFPSSSNVSTSVYDINNYRISAILDANNYATFYNYDEEGKLFMVKKETVKGIKTIKEERGHIKE